MRLREQFWLEVVSEAVREDRSLNLHLAPEPTVAPDFPARVRVTVEAAGGHMVFMALTVSQEEQERRLLEPSREASGKLRSLDILRQHCTAFTACEAAMPEPDLVIDAVSTTPEEAARWMAALIAA